MKFLIGEKQNMTQVFSEDGVVTPVTVIKAMPSTVVFLKSQEKDGYSAVQLGCGEAKSKNKSKAEKGHMKDYGVFKELKEFRITDSEESPAEGDKIDVSQFSEGDAVRLSSVSKGKGFQGVVRRHGFHGGPRTHGQKHSEREPGSIGATGPQRVLKGTKMAGRMGSDKVTLNKVKIVKVNAEDNCLFVKGAVPGKVGTLVKIQGK